MKNGRSSRLRISGLSATPGEPDRESALKTQGEIEAAISQGINRFEQEYMGTGPKVIHAHLIGDLLVVRLQGVLTAAEQQLVKSLPGLEVLIRKVTGVPLFSLHHDVSTITGEENILFTLAEPPLYRQAKNT
jgi:uncharacterized protein YbcI